MALSRDNEFRKNDDVTIKEAVDKMLDVYRLRRKYDETSILSAWPEIIGKPIANRTEKIYIRDKKLYVKVEYPVVKQELLIVRTRIVDRVNEYAGHDLITEFVLL